METQLLFQSKYVRTSQSLMYLCSNYIVRNTAYQLSMSSFPTRLIGIIIVFFLNATSVVFLGTLYQVYGQTSSRSDDGSSPLIRLQRPFPYFGRSYNQIYVRKNNFNKIHVFPRMLKVLIWNGEQVSVFDYGSIGVSNSQ